MMEEGIVGEYFEVGKYGTGRFVLYNTLSKIICKGCLLQKGFNQGSLTYAYMNIEVRGSSKTMDGI